MPNRSVVLGAGGHARVLVALLLELGLDESDIIVLDVGRASVTSEEMILGASVQPLPHELTPHAIGATVMYLAIGDSAIRQQWFYTARDAGFQLPALVARSAHVSHGVSVGDATVVGVGAHLGPMAAVGENVIVNTRAVVEHECRVGDHSHVAPTATLLGRVEIGSSVLVGANATINPNVRVVSDVTIGAGAVVARSLLLPGTYVGVPARLVAPK